MTLPPSTNDILSALEQRLLALRWDSAPAFSWVSRTDRSDLATALEEGQTTADRLCLVVYEGDRFENVHHGRQLHVRRTAQVSLLIADRQAASRTVAVFGSSDTPGAVILKDLVLGLASSDGDTAVPVSGLLLNTAFVQPISAVPIPLDERLSALSGRGAWLIRLEIIGGQRQLELGQPPFF